jgi:hypothetical protein
MRATAGCVMVDRSPVSRKWLPLLEALDYATSDLDFDSWGLIKEWTRHGQLPMRGQADGINQDIQPHWFNFLARWGCDDPESDGNGTQSGTALSVGPGKTSDRPRRMAQTSPRIDKTKPLTDVRSTSSDDILYFDVPHEKLIAGVKAPRCVSEIIVEMNALRQLIGAWKSANGAPAVAHVPVRAAVDEMIEHEAPGLINKIRRDDKEIRLLVERGHRTSTTNMIREWFALSVEERDDVIRSIRSPTLYVEFYDHETSTAERLRTAERNDARRTYQSLWWVSAKKL